MAAHQLNQSQRTEKSFKAGFHSVYFDDRHRGLPSLQSKMGAHSRGRVRKIGVSAVSDKDPAETLVGHHSRRQDSKADSPRSIQQFLLPITQGVGPRKEGINC